MKKLCPCLRKEEGIVLWWAGLRGAVGLLIAIEISETRKPGASFIARERTILVYVSVLTTATLVIFAPTIGWLLKKVGLLEVTLNQQQQDRYLKSILQEQSDKYALPTRTRLTMATFLS